MKFHIRSRDVQRHARAATPIILFHHVASCDWKGRKYGLHASCMENLDIVSKIWKESMSWCIMYLEFIEIFT